MAGQILNTGAFPPGSSAVFIDLINKLSVLLDNADSIAKAAADAAEDAAKAAAAAQSTANDAASAADSAADAAASAASAAASAQNTADGAVGAAANAQNTADVAVGAAANAADAAALAQDTADEVSSSAVKNNVTTLQVMQGPVSVGTELRINNVKVLGGRITGWTASTGTAVKGGFDADQTYTVGAAYAQAEIQAIADGLVELRKVVLALQQGATSHGLIGV